MINRFLAELLGTFVLSLVVVISNVYAMPVPAPVMAAIALGLFVYFVGNVSGAHLNPAVTIGLLSVNKIKVRDAITNILGQLAGAVLALLAGLALNDAFLVTLPHNASLAAGTFEALGAAMLIMGVCSCAFGITHKAASGLVVGLSLYLGIFLASPQSNAILNPAVALATGSFGVMYVFGPIVGTVIGALLFKFIVSSQETA